jgi:hypothetical protein
MTAIRTLPPSVSRERAVAMLSRGVAGRARRMLFGPLRSVAEVYVPYRLYRITNGGRASLLAIDAVSGQLDLYGFESIPASDLIADTRARNAIPVQVTADANRILLHDRMRRLIYQRVGFLAAGRFDLTIEPIDGTLHVPYWAGFFGSGEAATVIVIDAVRRRVEGAKVRRLVTNWLAA